MFRKHLVLLALVFCASSSAWAGAKCFGIDQEWHPYGDKRCDAPVPQPKTEVPVTPHRAVSVSATSKLLKSRASFRADSQAVCSEKWTKRGVLDNRMFDYCMKQQSEAYADLVSLDQYADKAFYRDTAFPYCDRQWTKRDVTDAVMLAHCLHQEVEGVKDVLYYRDKFGAAAVDPISNRAIARFGSWNMAAHEVKQAVQGR